MKMLIVDDVQEKIRKIMQTALEVEGVMRDDIDYAIETSTAKEKLLENEYDLLILDLVMPEEIIDESIENAGADFIDEILGIDSIRKPIEIVVLSAYEDCEVEFVKSNSRNAFHMLKYDVSSVVWQGRLKDIIKYRLLYSLQKKGEQIDYAIITTVPVETDAVRALAKEWRRIVFENDPHSYYVTEFEKDGLKKRVVNVQSADMGMVAASISTMNLNYHFKPKYIFITGIAAGIGNHSFGDIIVPSEVWNYSSGKYLDKEGELSFLPEPKVIPLDVKIANLVRQDYADVLKEIHKAWPVNNEVDLLISKTELSMYSLPLASGTAVVANFQLVKDMIISHSRKTEGIDMEAYGVFAAARSLCDNKPISICVKSISDFADKEKGDGYQPYASYTSACFTKYMIMELL